MRARKRTAQFIECQKKLYANERIRHMKHFSDTRWTSHDKVLSVIFDRYLAIAESLKEMINSSDRITASNSKSFLAIISTFEFSLCLVLFKKVFAITTPLSNYLQSKSIDFIEALKMVDVAKTSIINLRSDIEYDNFLNKTKTFCKTNNVVEQDFKETRNRKRKKMFDESETDEMSYSPSEKFKTQTYFLVLDQIISSFTNRFSQAKDILKDLSLLSPERLSNKNQELPFDNFEYISKWLDIDQKELKNEYIMLRNNFKELIHGLDLPKILHSVDSIPVEVINGDDESDSSSDDDDDSLNFKTNANVSSVFTIYELLSSYDLLSAFPNIYRAYQALGTIPTSSASAERSFSKVRNSCLIYLYFVFYTYNFI